MKCAHCGELKKEHHYNGACYGKCGKFIQGEVKMSELTIKQAQEKQPWTVPYSPAVDSAAKHGIPHILASHCVMHAVKSIGKLAAVFERYDHIDGGYSGTAGPDYNHCEMETIKAMSADLVTAALRFANLYKFDLETVFKARVLEKNGVSY